MKFCMKCCFSKHESEFYHHPKGKDGLFPYCKECHKAYARENSRLPKNMEARRIRDRKRFQRIKGTDKYKISVRRRHYRWNHSNRDKIKCHNAVYHALKRGTLTRLPCQACGSTLQVEAHHEDYSKPLNVVWLCNSCHRHRHPELVPKSQVG